MSNDLIKRLRHERISSEDHFPSLARQKQAPNSAPTRQNQKHQDVQAPVQGQQNRIRNIAVPGAIGCGGIGAIHGLVQQLGLADAIDRRLRLLKVHMPYRESEHVFNIAYIPLCNGICLQDIELRRNDENFLNALGVDRIPDPTTAGDFCRRFTRSDLYVLMDVINETRLKVWAKQPYDFFNRATIDMDGAHTETTGECPDPDGLLEKWARGFVRHEGRTSLQALLADMTQAIHGDFRYAKRLMARPRRRPKPCRCERGAAATSPC